MNNANRKVAIIGAGIIGTNCAFELQQLGFDVTLFDRSGIGEGCSKGNAGHFATEQVFPIAEVDLLTQLPKMLLDPQGPISLRFSYIIKMLPWCLSFINQMRSGKRLANINALKALNEHAISHYQNLLKKINAEHLITCNGSLLVFEKTSLSEIERIANQYKAEGIALSILDKAQCQAIEPNLSENIMFAIHFTDVAHTIDPYLLCKTIADYVIERGGQFISAKVTRIEVDQHFATVHASNNSYQFDQVVLATGAWAKELIEPLGYKVPIEAERGYHYQLGNNVQLNRPVASAERKFIITPMAKGLRCAGTVEFSGLYSDANPRRSYLLGQQAKHLLAINPEQLSGDQSLHQWHGPRPSFPDSLPVIGKAYLHDNLFFALGHQHLGLTLGAITGKLIGQAMTGKTTDINLSPFCLSRFN